MSKKASYEELILRVNELEKEMSGRALIAKDLHFKLMADLSFEAIAIHKNGVLLDANAQYFVMFGYERDELIGKLVIPLTVAPESIDELKNQVETESTSPYEIMGLRKDGSKFPVEINTKYIEYNGQRVRVGVIRDISSYKQAAEERKQLLSRIQTTLEATADGILVVDSNGKQVLFSSRFAKMWRIPDKILKTKDDDQVLAFVLDQLKDPDAFLAKVNHLYANPEVNSFDTIEFRDGRVFERYSRPHKLNDKVIGRVWSFRDVTERKQTEKALKESEQKYRDMSRMIRLMCDNVPDMIWAKDLEKRYIFSNKAICNNLLNAADTLEPIGKTDMFFADRERLSHPEVPQWHTFGEICRDSDSITMETCAPGKFDEYGNVKGEFLCLSVHKAPFYDENGKIIGTVGSARDVTGHKQAEKALIESETKFRTLYQASPQAIAMTKMKTGEIVEVNNKFCELFNYKREEILNRISTDVGFFSKLDREFFLKALQEAGRIDGSEVRVREKHGSYVICLLYARQIRLREESYILSFFTDISREKELEDEVRHSQKMESIGTLAGGIAHEFNNILSIIIGNNEIVGDETPDWSPVKENIEEIRIASMRARDVVRQLLIYSRKDDASKKPIEIGSLVKETTRLIRSSTPANIEISHNISGDLPLVIGNATQINQVLINLCSNAKDAILYSNGRIIIKLNKTTVNRDENKSFLSKVESGNYVKLIISDNGCGIGEESINNIFDPYFTTKEIGKGTGIGLAVVHGIVERHDGAIFVESTPEKGTQFTILFPAYEGKTDKPVDIEIDLPKGSEKIIFVDDEPSILKLVKQRLENLGYTVSGTTDPVEALKILESNPYGFDLVITDMAMPHMTGDQLVQKILKIRPEIPTILCTGYSEKISENEALELGVSSFVMKPLEKADFAMTVRKVLDEAK